MGKKPQRLLLVFLISYLYDQLNVVQIPPNLSTVGICDGYSFMKHFMHVIGRSVRDYFKLYVILSYIAKCPYLPSRTKCNKYRNI